MAGQQGSSPLPSPNRFCRDFYFLFPGTKIRGQGSKGTLEKFSNYGNLGHRLAPGFFPKAHLAITFNRYFSRS